MIDRKKGTTHQTSQTFFSKNPCSIHLNLRKQSSKSWVNILTTGTPVAPGALQALIQLPKVLNNSSSRRSARLCKHKIHIMYHNAQSVCCSAGVGLSHVHMVIEVIYDAQCPVCLRAIQLITFREETLRWAAGHRMTQGKSQLPPIPCKSGKWLSSIWVL